MSESTGRPGGSVLLADPRRTLVHKSVMGATWLVLWRFITRALGVVSMLVLARLLVPADFGLVAMATTFAAAVDALSQLGLQDALVRHPGDARKLYDAAFTLQLGRAVITSGIIAVGAPFAAWWFGEPRLIAVMLVLAATAALSGFENVGIIEFRREMRYDRQFRMFLAPRLLQVLLTIPLAFALRSYWALLAGIVIGRLARTAITYWMHPYRPKLRLAGWRELAGFSFWTWWAALANLVWERCEPFILGPAIGAARLGLYLLAAEMASLPITELVAPSADVLFAGFSSAQQQGTRSINHAPLVATALMQGIMPVVIAVSCASGYLVAALLGPKWIQAQHLVAIIAWLCPFSPYSYVCSAMLVANGFVRRNFVGNAAAAGVKVTAILIAISVTRRLDIIAVVGTGCVVAESFIFTLLLKGAGDVRLRDIAGGVARTILAAGVAVFVLYRAGLAWQVVAVPSLPALFYCVLTGMIAVVVFWPVDLLLWLLSGRPLGPETALLSLAGRYFPFVGRLKLKNAG